jgi:hypothetical protein
MTDQQESNNWRPHDQGHQPELKGVMVSAEPGTSSYGEYPIVKIQEDGTGKVWTVHAFHTVLRQNIARCMPKPGDRLEIAFLGKTPDTPQRKGYYNWQVSGGQPREYDWSRELPRGAGPLQVVESPDVPIEPVAVPRPQPTPAGAQYGDDVPF